MTPDAVGWRCAWARKEVTTVESRFSGAQDASSSEARQDDRTAPSPRESRSEEALASPLPSTEAQQPSSPGAGEVQPQVAAEPQLKTMIPRHCVYKEFEGAPGPCPRCGALLRKESQTYVVRTRHGSRAADSFVVGSDFGWFCGRCPTVVIHSAELAPMLQASLPSWDVGEDVFLEGLVDFDAVPKEKARLPIGGDDNPIPPVRFSNAPGPRSPQTAFAAEPQRAGGAEAARKKKKRLERRKQKARQRGRG